MEWFTRTKIWTRASPDQIKAVYQYINNEQETQIIGEPVVFKDARFKNGTIYTVYMRGDTIVELLYDDPIHVAYINRLTS